MVKTFWSCWTISKINFKIVFVLMKAYYSSNVEKVNGYVSIYTLKFHISIFSLLQLSSCVWLFVTPWITAFQASLSITNSQSSLKTHVHRVNNAIQPSHPLSSPSPPAPQSLPASEFSSESTVHIRWPKYWSFSFSIGPSSEHPGRISFRMDWLDLLAS